MYTLFIDAHLYDINVVLYKDGNVYLNVKDLKDYIYSK